MNIMTIEAAINYISINNSNLPYDTEVTGFDLSKLISILPDKSCYNNNYYLYNNHLLLEECIEDADTVIYYLVIGNNKFMLGCTNCYYKPEIINLYTSW